MKGISVIVPVYDEVEIIKDSLNSLQGVLRGSGLDYELIVVDDGSTDGTKDILAGLKASIRLIRHARNRGYGAALKTGIRHAQHADIIIVDSDKTYPFNLIPDMAASLFENDCEMIVGARKGDSVHVPHIRRPVKWFLQKLAEYLTGEEIADLNSGFRGMKKDIVERFMNILPDGFSFTTTITLALLTNGYRIEYMPISYARRKGRSKIRPLRDTMNFIQLIFRTVLYFNPLKIFLPLSALLFLLGGGVLLYSYFFTEKVMDVTTVVILMASFQIFAIGLIADLIDKRMKG